MHVNVNNYRLKCQVGVIWKQIYKIEVECDTSNAGNGNKKLNLYELNMKESYSKYLYRVYTHYS